MIRTNQIIQNIKKNPVVRHVIPQEAATGWPVPSRKKQPDGAYKLYLSVPFIGQSPIQGGGVNLYAPFATVTFDLSNGQLVEYVNLRYTTPALSENSDQPTGVFPHDAAKELGSIGQYLEAKARLFELYDDLIDSLESDTPATNELMSEFTTLLRKLVEPSLLPFYRKLYPKFYEQFLPE